MLQFSPEYGTIENTLEVLKVVQTGKLLDVIERFYIYNKASKQKQIMNEQYITDQNILFKMLLKYSKYDNKKKKVFNLTILIFGHICIIIYKTLKTHVPLETVLM
jgi:hypothetical protein